MKRNYKLYQENNEFESDDIIDVLLYNRGIPELSIEDYKSAGYFEILNPFEINNMGFTVHWFRHFLEETLLSDTNNEIGILVDCDCDGFCSASMLYSFLTKDLKYNCKYFIHNGKQHGLTDSEVFEQIANSGIKLLFIPDAGSDNYDEIKSLYENQGIKTIVLDHHSMSDEAKLKFIINPNVMFFEDLFVQVVNPYMPDYYGKNYVNKELSGACVTWKFIEAYKQKYNIITGDYSDLAMLSLIGDNMDIREIENRAIINYGLEHINNLMFQAMLNAKSFDINILKLTPNDLAFGIVPLINAVVRVGSLEDKELLFRGMCELDTGEQYDCKKKNKETGKFDTVKEGFFEHVARRCINLKKQQDKVKLEDKVYCIEVVKDNNLDDNEIIVVNGNNKINKNFTGLTAIQVAEYFNKPTIILNPNEDTDTPNYLLGGSMRNIDGGLPDLKKVLLDTNMFKFVEGHENAAGVAIRRQNVSKMIALMNDYIKSDNYWQGYLVDDIVEFEDIDTALMNELMEFNKYVGTQMPPIKLVVNNIEFDASDIMIMGKNKDTFKVTLKDIEIIKFQADDDLLELAESFESSSINIIAQPKLNTFGGKVTFQLQILDYEIN